MSGATVSSNHWWARLGAAHPVNTDDQTLIERCRSGDVAAFEPLVEKYRDRVWRLALNVVRDREDAWDVAQEAFIRAWQALPSFRGQSAFYTWLFRIVMNVAADRMRQRAARGRAFGTEPVPEEDWERTMPDQGPGPEDEALRAEERERIRRALSALPEHHRTVIMLNDLEGLSYREIAEVLDIPMGTVMSRLHNARKRLRDLLGPMLAILLTVLAAAVLTTATPSTAHAQRIVRFSAQVLIASDGSTSAPHDEALPEELRQLLPKLQQLFRYKEYRLLQQFRGEAPIGGFMRWQIIGDRTLSITPEAVTDKGAQLQIRVLRSIFREIGTSLQVTPGVPAVIGGPRHDDGVLIIVVWLNR
jgi:RNA polymerase sigma-70 factor (ECF subfamily)